MQGTKKTILFITAFFITLAFMSIVAGLLNPTFVEMEVDTFNEIVAPAFYTLYFFFFLFVLSFIRKITSKKALKGQQPFLSLKVDIFNLNESLWLYLIILLIYLLPMLRTFSLASMTLPRSLLLVFSLLIAQFFIRFSKRTMIISFLRDGMVISGTDLRITLPFIYGTHIHNDSGVYSYNDVENYFIFPDHIDFYLIGEQGKLSFEVDGETTRQIQGLLKQANIPMKKFK